MGLETADDQQSPFRPLSRDSLAATESRTGRLNPNDTQPDENSKQGRKLPWKLRQQLSPSLTNAALEEIDPHYKDHRTFVVIDKSHRIYRFSATNSLWLLSPFNPIRRIAIFILLQSWFHFIIAATIITNCVFMTVPTTPTVITVHMVCLAIFTFEMLVKIIARGFILQPFTYLRHPWNWLDFIVTFLIYLSLGVHVDLNTVQMWRSLRLMQIACHCQWLKVYAKAVVKSIRHLKDAIFLLFLVLSVMAVFALELYMGVLTQKCVRVPEDGFDNYTNWDRFASSPENWYYGDDYDAALCGNSSGSGVCPQDYSCLQGYGQNPNYGYTNFDTFGWSWLSVFRLTVRDYWESLYQMILKTAGPWHVLFFSFVIFGVSLNFTSLILSIVTVTYEDVEKKEQETTTLVDGATKSENDEESESVLSKVTDFLCVWDCSECWTTIQKFISLIIFNPLVELFIVICIVINAIFLVLDQHDMSVKLARTISYGSFLCLLIFGIEITLKIIAMSPKFYFKNKWNQFDFVIVGLPLVVFGMISLGIELYPGMTIWRILTLLRLTKLWKCVPTMNFLITVALKSVASIAKLAIVMTIVISIFAIIGMHLIGELYSANIDRFPDSELPRWSFIDFLHSYMIIFRSLCSEWIESMWDCMLIGDVSCISYFFSAAFICYLILFNLFTAVVISNFRHCRRQCSENRHSNGLGKAFHKIIRCKKEQKDEELTPNTNTIIESLDAVDRKTDEDPEDCLPKSCYEKLAILRGNDTWFEIRLKTLTLINSKYFEALVFIVIAFSSVALTLEDVYLPNRPSLQDVLYHVDIVIAVLFLIEMLIMWLGLGLKRYFKDGSCVLDFVVVLALLINFGVQSNILKAIRSLRMLRFVTAVKRKSMKILTATLSQSLAAIFFMLVLAALIWLPFAVTGVQLFAGKFFKCFDDNMTTLSHEITPDRNSCMYLNYTWENSMMNFDDVASAYLSLTQVATFKGWIQIMNDAVDSREVNTQPIREVNVYMYYYFIMFAIFGSFLTLSMFVGIIFDSYSKQKPQNRLNDSLEVIKTKTPTKAIPKPNWKPQALVYDMVTNKYFEVVMLVFIVLNFAIMGMDHYQIGQAFSSILEWSNLIFIVIFTVECILKIFAFNCDYFKKSWNWFDFVLVVYSITGLVVNDVLEKWFISPTLLILLRIIRIVKIRPLLQHVRYLKGIRVLYFTISRSLSSLFCICFLLFLLTYVYSIFGMVLFKHTGHRGGFNSLINFQTYGQSMLLLIQISTWAGWDGFLYGFLIPDETSCCQQLIAILYLLSFMFMSFILFNLYFAVVFHNYIQAVEDVEKGLTEDDFDMFYTTWQQFDPNATKYIPYNQLSDFLAKLKPPLSIKKPNKYKITMLDIPIHSGDRMLCSDVLVALIRDVYGIEPAPRCFKRSSTLNKQRQEYCAKIIQNNWRKFRGIALNRSESGRRDLGTRQTVVLLDTDGSKN